MRRAATPPPGDGRAGCRDVERVLRESLRPPQIAAVCDPAAEVLTLACAGSGKSRTLAFRIARLVAQGEAPSGIVAFTFTEKAADTIKRRVAVALSAVGLDPAVLGAMYIGTIHSYCNNVLMAMDARYRQFDVLDENRLKLYLISRYPALGLHRLQARPARYFEIVRQVSDAWKTLNDEMITIPAVAAPDPLLGDVLQRLTDRMRVDHFIDFSLMVRRVAEALENGEAGALRATQDLRHLMVDEYQDVNPSQEVLIRQLRARAATLFVVGDDDQAVYGWRGADVNNILTFPNRYPGCASHTLSHNFRSTTAVVRAADEFIAMELGPARIAKDPQADPPLGPSDFRKLWFATRQEEAEWVADRIAALLGTGYVERDGGVTRGLTPGDFAILMRSTRRDEQNGQPRHGAFTQALQARGIDFTLEAGGSAFDRPQVATLRDAFELLRLRPPTRVAAQAFFDQTVRPAYPAANFDRFVRVLSDWGRLIHGPIAGPRRRVYPQQLVHDLLSAFGIAEANFLDGVMRDVGIFSRILQDVEAVYLSIDSTQRFQQILNFLQNVAETGYDTSTEDILRRPDAVTVSTVHKAKGLEFPAVFVVDVEAQRFPNRRRSYDGWLPPQVIQPALARGAYQGTPAEEARLFYTAVTRAERFLYVTGSQRLPGGARRRQRSPFWIRLQHPDLSQDPNGLPNGLVPHRPYPRIDDKVMPTSYSEIRYYLLCPRDYLFRKVFGFSPPIPELFGFGMTVHTAVGKLHELFPNQAPTPAQAEEVARDIFHLKHVPRSADPVNRPGAYEQAQESAARIARTYSENFAEDFTHERQVEARFEVPVQGAVISGVIDLLLRFDEHGNLLEARVIDFKAVEGGENALQNERLRWTDLALQVQLYAKGAREVLGENARTGAVHLLKDNQRIDVPVSDEAIQVAVANVEWAVQRILARDFPMRPHPDKCQRCDFRQLCPRTPQAFASGATPPPIHTPAGPEMAPAFSQFQA